MPGITNTNTHVQVRYRVRLPSLTLRPSIKNVPGPFEGSACAHQYSQVPFTFPEGREQTQIR